MKIYLRCGHALMVENGALSQKIDYIIIFRRFYILKGIKIALLVQELLRFCWMGWFCLWACGFACRVCACRLCSRLVCYQEEYLNFFQKSWDLKKAVIFLIFTKSRNNFCPKKLSITVKRFNKGTKKIVSQKTASFAGGTPPLPKMNRWSTFFLLEIFP